MQIVDNDIDQLGIALSILMTTYKHEVITLIPPIPPEYLYQQLLLAEATPLFNFLESIKIFCFLIQPDSCN